MRFQGWVQNHKITLSKRVGQKFEEALEHLQADGCTRLHIIAHSMGARVVAGAARRIQRLFPQSLDPLAEPRDCEVAATFGPRLMDLVSMTFISPDVDFGAFMAQYGPIFRSICALITIYGDPNDDALFWSSFLNSYYFKLKPNYAPPGLKEEWCELQPVAMRAMPVTL
jgi:esterase/lipase superfamily enzyme